jgi:hypothetical protein
VRIMQLVIENPVLITASSLVALVSMAFGIIGIIACACCKDVESKMNNTVITTTPEFDSVSSS